MKSKKQLYVKMFRRTFAVTAAVLAAVSLSPSTVLAVEASCARIMGLIGEGGLQSALITALGGNTNNADANTGLPLAQWAAVVDRDGNVCSVVFSGPDRQSQWPASRAISMQKANAANSLSLDGLALSTANLWAATQPGGSLFGLQFSNPVDTGAAYKGPATEFGTDTGDPAVGERVGGINVFGGGLALYSQSGVIGGLGTSGNTSCADHIIGWKTRNALGLDFVPGGVSPTGDDNIIFDIVDAKPAKTGGPSTVSASGFGHPLCGFGDEKAVAESLPVDFPITPIP
jgi:uncharacterized protein GlcG (DUF336 family)